MVHYNIHNKPQIKTYKLTFQSFQWLVDGVIDFEMIFEYCRHLFCGLMEFNDDLIEEITTTK